jgi:hypothetical protein
VAFLLTPSRKWSRWDETDGIVETPAPLRMRLKAQKAGLTRFGPIRDPEKWNPCPDTWRFPTSWPETSVAASRSPKSASRHHTWEWDHKRMNASRNRPASQLASLGNIHCGPRCPAGVRRGQTLFVVPHWTAPTNEFGAGGCVRGGCLIAQSKAIFTELGAVTQGLEFLRSRVRIVHAVDVVLSSAGDCESASGE